MDLAPGIEWTAEAEGRCELVVMPKLLLDIEKVTKLPQPSPAFHILLTPSPAFHILLTPSHALSRLR